MAGLGLVGGYGLRAAFDALRNQRREMAFNQEREREEAERQFQRGIDLRRIAETEAEGASGRSYRDTSLAHDLRRLVNQENQQAFTNEGVTADRQFTASERARAADERKKADDLIEQVANAASKRQLQLQRLGVQGDRSLFQTPEEIGGEKGRTDLSAWTGGGQKVFKDQTQMQANAQAQVAGARAAAADRKTPEQLAKLDAVAKMVIDNPDVLDKFNAADRGEILTHMASSGSGLENQRRDKSMRLQREALEALVRLREMPGREGAIGAPSLYDPGSWQRIFTEDAMQGSPARSYQEQLKRVRSAVTTPRLQLMSGFGALSNADIEMLSKSATSLGSAQNEAEYEAELQRLQETLSKGIQTISRTQLQNVATAKGTTLDEQIKRYKDLGYVVVR